MYKLSLRIFLAIGSLLAEYRFSQNYGQVLKDYTGNSLHAVNGETSSSDSYDTMPTDRGAYIGLLSNQRIKLPPNDNIPALISLGPIYSSAVWVMVTQGITTCTILYRLCNTDGSYLYIKRDFLFSRLKVRIQTLDTDSGILYGSTGNFATNTWVYVEVHIVSTSVKFYMNGAVDVSTTLNSVYSEGINVYQGYIGYYDSIDYPIQGFIWNFMLFDTDSTSSLFVGSSYTVGRCASYYSCPSSCPNSYISNGLTYCLPTGSNPLLSLLGIACPLGCANGCYGNVCLDCTCGTGSCIVVESSSSCYCSYTYSVLSSCECPVGKYYNGNECVGCPSSCATCDQDAVCITCVSPFATVNANGSCKCNNGYYGNSNLNVNQCSQCYAECSACTQDLICSSCVANHASPDAVQGCKCDPGYYGSTLTSTSSCLVCYNECATCNQALICMTCVASNASPDATQGCKCNSGYYGTSLTAVNSCSLCYNECASCSQALLCVTCIASNSSPDVSQGCKCNAGYYGTSLTAANSCLLCYNECATCIQASLCNSCIASNASPDITQGCKCNSGYYGTSLTTVNSCALCYIECLTCTQALICSTCVASNSSPDTTQGCKCNVGYYGTSLTTINSCLLCYTECATCSQALLCDTCVALNSSPDTIQGCKCNDGFYGSTLSTPNACHPCDSSCATCIGGSPTQCLLCADPAMTLNSQSACQCNSQYYLASGVCVPCFQDCLTCDNSITCLSCKASNTILVSGLCKCLPYYYIQSYNPLACFACDPMCSTCTGPLESHCVTCAASNAEPLNGKCACGSGYFTLSSVPLICSSCFSGCKSCIGPLESHCTSCIDPNASPSIIGACSCNSGYVKISEICVACHISCSICSTSNPIFCLVCRDPSALMLNPGPCTCSSGSYLTIYGYCASCHPDCSTCTGASNAECLGCSDINSKLILGLCTCNKGYYNYLSHCKKCKSSCIECTGYEKCSSCLPGFVFINSTCVCKDEFYENSDGNCSACIQNCVKCKANITCESCGTGYMYDGTAGKCSSVTEYDSIQKVIGNIYKGLIYIASAITLTSLMSSNQPSLIWTSINSAQMISYIPLQNINLPPLLYKFLLALQPINILPNIFNQYNLLTCASSDLNPSYIKYGYTCEYFIINTGQTTLSFTISLTLALIIYSLTFAMPSRIKVYLNEKVLQYRWNFFLRFWIESFLDIAVPCVIAINNILWSTPIKIINSVIGIVMFVAVGLSSGCNCWLILKFMKISKDKQANFYLKYRSVLEEFRKKKKGLRYTLYYPYFFMRRLVFAVILYNLSVLPVMQIVLNVSHSVVLVVYLIKAKPFKNKRINRFNMIQEVMLSVIFAFTGMFILDLSTRRREILAYFLIAIVSLTVGIGYLYSFYHSWHELREKCKKRNKIMHEIADDSIDGTRNVKPESSFIDSPNFKSF